MYGLTVTSDSASASRGRTSVADPSQRASGRDCGWRVRSRDDHPAPAARVGRAARHAVGGRPRKPGQACLQGGQAVQPDPDPDGGLKGRRLGAGAGAGAVLHGVQQHPEGVGSDHGTGRRCRSGWWAVGGIPALIRIRTPTARIRWRSNRTRYRWGRVAGKSK